MNNYVGSGCTHLRTHLEALYTWNKNGKSYNDRNIFSNFVC